MCLFMVYPLINLLRSKSVGMACAPSFPTLKNVCLDLHYVTLVLLLGRANCVYF